MEALSFNETYHAVTHILILCDYYGAQSFFLHWSLSQVWASLVFRSARKDIGMADFVSLSDVEKVGVVLVVCVFFGGFGGLVAHFVNNEKATVLGTARSAKREGKREDWYLFPSSLESICIGVAGAIGFLFFIAAVGGISSSSNGLEAYLRTISSSVIAGFCARSLLSKMAGQLEKQVAEAQSKAEELEKQVAGAQSKAEELEEKVAGAQSKAEEAVGDARVNDVKVRQLEASLLLLDAIGPNAGPPAQDKAIDYTKALISNGEATAAHWGNLARLYRRMDNLPEAIATLDKVIPLIERGELNGRLNPFYYNRGCYKAMQYGDGECKDKGLLAASLSDLAAAINSAVDKEEEKKTVWGDKDWEPLANEEGFIALVGQKR